MNTVYDTYYADGAFRPSAGTSHVRVVDPTREAPCAELRFCSAADVDVAVRAARRGFDSWQHSSLDERRALLARLKAALEERADAIVHALAREMGCPVWLGRLMQLPMPLQGLELTAAGMEAITWNETVGNGRVERVPAGVVAAITPWNFPVHQIVAKVAAAIAAGCAAVLKPSELAPGAAHLFMQAVDAAGVPPGVVNMVWGDAGIGDLLVRHPGVDRISFTGSTAVGRRIMAAAADRLTPVTLELGGKSAAVLLDDADLATALPVVARMGLANSGQACVSQARIIVPRARRDDVIAGLRQACADWQPGDPLDPGTRLGPVASKAQFDHVTAMVVAARSQGACCMAGGEPWLDGGYFVRPTLFADVTPDMDLARREVFGPVIALMTYGDEGEAAALANASDYGLSGAVWSGDAGRATRFAQRMRTGQVVINGAPQNLATPFGGWGLSGYGRENGRFGIEDLLQYRSLHGAA